MVLPLIGYYVFNNEEFYEVEEKENEEKDNNKKEDKKVEKEDKDKIKELRKKSISPVKDSENIKLSMKKLNFKAPKWAENMNDKDFINMAQKIISSKK